MLMRRAFFGLYLLILIFLALPVVKIGGARIEQLLVLFTFLVVFYDDLNKKSIDFSILLYLVIGALIMVLISLNSDYPKVDEKNYFIKFLFIYPVGFYVGARIFAKLTLKEVITLLDLTLLFYVVSWLIIMYVPLPMSLLSKVVHLREFGFGLEFLPYQGTFYEAGALGIIVGTVILFSAMLRIEFNVWCEKRYLNYVLYGFTFFMIVVSKNKTVWLAYGLILLFLAFYKIYLLLQRSNYYTPSYILKQDSVLKNFININVLYLIGGVIVLGVLFFLYNSLAPEPFITAQEFDYKMKHERGAQFMIGWELIEKSHYFGGYGWGFVESFFEGKGIMGVGKGSGSINSVLLDSWLQGSIVAVFYFTGIIMLAFSNKHLLTITVPLYFLFFGLTNPIIAEEFFLFTGMSYSFASIKEQAYFFGETT